MTPNHFLALSGYEARLLPSKASAQLHTDTWGIPELPCPVLLPQPIAALCLKGQRQTSIAVLPCPNPRVYKEQIFPYPAVMLQWLHYSQDPSSLLCTCVEKWMAKTRQNNSLPVLVLTAKSGRQGLCRNEDRHFQIGTTGWVMVLLPVPPFQHSPFSKTPANYHEAPWLPI